MFVINVLMIVGSFEGRIEPINFDELDESLNSMESTGISSSQGTEILASLLD